MFSIINLCVINNLCNHDKSNKLWTVATSNSWSRGRHKFLSAHRVSYCAGAYTNSWPKLSHLCPMLSQLGSDRPQTVLLNSIVHSTIRLSQKYQHRWSYQSSIILIDASVKTWYLGRKLALLSTRRINLIIIVCSYVDASTILALSLYQRELVLDKTWISMFYFARLFDQHMNFI